MLMMFYSFIVTYVIAYYESIGVIIVQSTHVVAKFIRSMSHCVTCSNLTGLLKSCSVFWVISGDSAAQCVCSLQKSVVETKTNFLLCLFFSIKSLMLTHS